jgi:predicted permease
MLRKHPGFAAAAIITLALAIGANTAIFSVVYPVLLRSLPFQDPDRLVTVGEARPEAPCCAYWASYPDFLDWTADAKSFQSLAGYASDAFTITGNGEPKTVYASMVTTNFFSTLGVTPVLGRTFLPGEDLPSGSGPNVAIITYSFWRSDFAGDRSVIGRSIRLDGRLVTIVGVLPRDFELGPAGIVPVWVPLHLNPFERSNRTSRWLEVVGRLTPGVSLQQARSEMNNLEARLASQYGTGSGGAYRVDIAPLREQIVGDIRPLLMVLFGAVGFVLLIACANVANLMLSRSLDRRREFAIRAALGASRAHIVVQLLIESLTLALMGAVLGFLGAAVGVWLLTRSIPEIQLSFMPYLNDVGISFPVMGFIAGITLLTAVLFGLGPGISVSRTPITDVLKEESRGGTSSTQNRMRNLLVIAEIAVSLVLLAGGGLMLQSLRGVLRQNPGFDPNRVLTFVVNLPASTYPPSKAWPYDNSAGLRFTHAFLERLRTLPGVQGASATNSLPVAENLSGNRFVIEGHQTAGEENTSTERHVDPDYFSVMKVPLIRGRELANTDTVGRPDVVVVNQNWVKRYMSAGDDPIGKRIRFTNVMEEPYREIVGVVGDVAENSLAAPVPPVIYVPLDQDSGYSTYMNYVVRTTGDPEGLMPLVRSAARSIDPGLAFTEPQSMERFMNSSPAIFLRRYPFYMVGGFAVLAIVLAVVGLYGLISYSVLQRTREIGIRMALGAGRKDILRLTIRQGIIDTVVGVVLGLVLAILLTRVMTRMLYGVKAGDWLTFVGVALLLLIIAMVASYIPARKATEVDPMIALRNE